MALIQVQGTDFVLEPIPLRTVRPFIAEDLELRDVAEEENIDLNDQIEVMKLIRRKVEAKIFTPFSGDISQILRLNPDQPCAPFT